MGEKQLLHNMLSIKSAEVDWDLGGCGGRLGGAGSDLRCVPSFACLFSFSLA